jgi:hypothetical protein
MEQFLNLILPSTRLNLLSLNKFLTVTTATLKLAKSTTD